MIGATFSLLELRYYIGTRCTAGPHPCHPNYRCWSFFANAVHSSIIISRFSPRSWGPSCDFSQDLQHKENYSTASDADYPGTEVRPRDLGEMHCRFSQRVTDRACCDYNLHVVVAMESHGFKLLVLWGGGTSLIIMSWVQGKTCIRDYLGR